MSIKKVIEPESVHRKGNNDKGGNQRQRANPLYLFLIGIRMFFICFILLLGGMLFCVGEAEAVNNSEWPGQVFTIEEQGGQSGEENSWTVGVGVWSSGWESENSLVDGTGYIYHGHGTPSIGFNVMGDGNWTFISGAKFGEFYGYYWNGTQWIEDSSRVAGLENIGYWSALALVLNLTGDGNWTLISRAIFGKFHGYYWNGTQWIEDSSRVAGLDVIPGMVGLTILDNLTGDGNWTLISGNEGGTFNGYYWNGTQWIEDSSRVNGLGDVGSHSKVTASFNVTSDGNWTLITGNEGGTFNGYYWNGTQWIEDSSRVVGLGDVGMYSAPAMAFNLRGDGKWILISGSDFFGYKDGFIYNTVDIEALSPIDASHSHILATTAHINWTYDRTWDHRVEYSVNHDLNAPQWSDWQKDTDVVDIRLWNLQPNTTYYYKAYTYIPWDHSYYVNTPIQSFTTLECTNYEYVNPGESIQDAIDMLCSEGGVIELAEGTHEITQKMYPTGTFELWGGKTAYYSIIITKSNVTIRGTHDSTVRHHTFAYGGDRGKSVRCFFIPDLEFVEGPDVFVENTTFKGFTTTSTYTAADRALNSIISGYHVKNFTVENMHSTSRTSSFTTVDSLQSHQRYSYNIVYENNTIEHGSLLVGFAENVSFLNNTVLSSVDIFPIHASRNLKYIRIIGNKVIEASATSMVLNGADMGYWVVRDNFLHGGKMGVRFEATPNHVIFENNTITGATQYGGITIYGRGFDENTTIRNNRIYNCAYGIYTDEYADAWDTQTVNIENNVIYDITYDGIRMTKESVTLILKNNIIANTGGYGINRLAGNISHSYNNIGDNALGDYNGTTEGTSEIHEDPLFADPANRDFHLKSTAGRWDAENEEWVTDDEDSPCIDAGDPASDYSNEPEPNGGRINMGAYGNTGEASKSPPPTITSFYPPSPVSDVEGKTRTFNITVDHVVNVTWMINGTQVQPINESVTEASYTNVSAKVGTWNVSAIATSVTTGLSAMQTWIWIVRPAEFDTGPGTYPSIFGTHRGKITPGHDVYVSKMYTYPCAGTGGHSEYAAFCYSNGTKIAEANWTGYSGDWHNISFSTSFSLEAGKTYGYEIITGSYPQIHHNKTLTVPDGEITCTKFTDANGKIYNNWIPAISLK